MDLLKWLETFGLFVLLAVFFCACCPYCYERAWKSTRGAVLADPNPNVIVITQGEETSPAFRSSGGQQQLKSYREERVRALPENTTNQQQYLSPATIDTSYSRNSEVPETSICSTQFTQQMPMTSATTLVQTAPPLINSAEQEQHIRVAISYDPAPPYPGPPPGESCL